ncbi:hypothetical protein MKX07_001646 [Trichoderma sp. CBMAI-0711]|nr:hypothetical protein MKX07_001646 [Trichoderma sp. CBMAI-0711]
MSWGPVPSKLYLLSQLQDVPVGDKVRFLGWYVLTFLDVFSHLMWHLFTAQASTNSVISYDTATACLKLGHMYPPGTNETVRVDIELVLETIQPGLTQVGQWVNVVGYIREGRGSPVHVQALLVWLTGPLDLGRYEKSLQDQMMELA